MTFATWPLQVVPILVGISWDCSITLFLITLHCPTLVPITDPTWIKTKWFSHFALQYLLVGAYGRKTCPFNHVFMQSFIHWYTHSIFFIGNIRLNSYTMQSDFFLIQSVSVFTLLLLQVWAVDDQSSSHNLTKGIVAGSSCAGPNAVPASVCPPKKTNSFKWRSFLRHLDLLLVLPVATSIFFSGTS